MFLIDPRGRGWLGRRAVPHDVMRVRHERLVITLQRQPAHRLQGALRLEERLLILETPLAKIAQRDDELAEVGALEGDNV